MLVSRCLETRKGHSKSSRYWRETGVSKSALEAFALRDDYCEFRIVAQKLTTCDNLAIKALCPHGREEARPIHQRLLGCNGLL